MDLLTDDGSIFTAQNNSKFQEFLQGQQDAITRQIELANPTKRKRAITIQAEMQIQQAAAQSSQSPPLPTSLSPNPEPPHPHKRQRLPKAGQGRLVSHYLH